MEYLENLLWMWQYVNTSRIFGKVPENLKFKIMEVARQIYCNNMSGIDAYVLWRVYQAKFNIGYSIFSVDEPQNFFQSNLGDCGI